MANSVARVAVGEEETAPESAEERQQPSKTTWKSYTIERKLAAISKVDEHSGNIARASRESGVERGCLQQWLKRVELEGKRTERSLSVKKRRKCSSEDTATAGS